VSHVSDWTWRGWLLRYHGPMQLVLPENSLPAKLTLSDRSPMDDDAYYAFCMANPDRRFERTAQGEIVIVPPAGGESAYRGAEATSQLNRWARRDRRGIVFDASAEFILPDGAALSPDAAWVSHSRLGEITREQFRKFPPVCPEFVIEVMSPSDRLSKLKRKMRQWAENGVQLAWLIDADRQTVYIYRAGRPEPEIVKAAKKLQGEGPVSGLEMNMRYIWGHSPKP